MLQNGGETAATEEGVCKTELHRAGWALPRPFLYIRESFLQNKKKILSDVLTYYLTNQPYVPESFCKADSCLATQEFMEPECSLPC
jgi:hypothetical protein